MKYCAACHTWKEENNFTKDTKKKDGFYGHCKSCNCERTKLWYKNNKHRHDECVKKNYIKHRESIIARKYGLKITDINKLLQKQNNECAICGMSFKKNRQIDHDHKTGIVRGILCAKCNRGLGQFNDDPAILVKALRYIEGTCN